MQVSAEVSLYPLADEFVPAVDRFIAWLGAQPGLEVSTGPMSTLVYGELDTVMAALRDGMARTFGDTPHAMFALRVLGSDARPLARAGGYID